MSGTGTTATHLAVAQIMKALLAGWKTPKIGDTAERAAAIWKKTVRVTRRAVAEIRGVRMTDTALTKFAENELFLFKNRCYKHRRQR